MALSTSGLFLTHGSAEAQAARAASAGLRRTDDVVRINANENPLGPSKAALEAMAKLGTEGGRYAWKQEHEFVNRVAEIEQVPPEYVLTFAGSSDPLHRAVLAFTGPDKSFVGANPGYEAGFRATKITGGRAIEVPMTTALAHDVKGMCSADPGAGLLYICNPNNPTGTTTTRDDILYALANKPAGSILVVDEAYIHLSDEQTVAPLVAKHADLLVLRTFSKLYGMAGIRLGLAIANPEILDKLKTWGMGSVSGTAVAAGLASINEPKLITERRSYIKSVREETFSFLDKHNYKFRPSVSNCFMLEVGRPAKEFATAMAERGVLVGRSWPVWPTEPRITVGNREEMKKFCSAMTAVMA
jgi:histidinol-phosphate aminotransferase